MNRNKVLGLLGLAEKAGKVRSGEFSTEKAVKSGKAGLVIVSEESSDNTKKMFRNMCTYYKVPYFEFGSKEELGHILGKQMRASLAVIDENFSNALLKHFTAKAESCGHEERMPACGGSCTLAMVCRDYFGGGERE